MKVKSLVLTGLVLVPTVLQGQGCPEAAALTRGFRAPMSHVRYLADDALQGRLAGSPGERCAGEYIAAQFKQLGLEPAGENGTYFQSLPLASAVNPHGAGGTGRNVVALLPGSDPAAAAQVVIVGAHYDHLGLGDFSASDPAAKGQVHNGADDNASGVAAMLQVAAELAHGKRPARPVLFIAFTGEESGLLGSAYFTNHPTVPIKGAKAMLNLDMVGRLENRPLVVYGVGSASEWREAVQREATSRGLTLSLIDDGYGPSDQTSFYASDIPVLHFFTNTHGQYHSALDDWERIDSAGLGRIAALTAAMARQVADATLQVTLVRGAGQKPQPGAGRAGGYGAYLGTVPDFSPVERGVLLGGVSAGSPAEKAGLRKGDVLIGLAGEPVADLQGMTDVLRKHRPGETVELLILREGKEQKLSTVLGTRQQ